MYRLSKIILFSLFLVLINFSSVFAQELGVEKKQSEYTSAKVIGVSETEDSTTSYRISLANGQEFDINAYGETLVSGQKVFVETTDGESYYYVAQDRSRVIFLLVALFIISIIVLAGKKGLRSLLSLVMSFVLLFMVFVPLLFHGYDPLWLTLFFGLFVLGVSIFITHGFNKQSLTSFLGAFGSVVFATALLVYIMHVSSVSGVLNEDVQYLSIQTKEALDIVRLISAGIVIGVLGVLDDITITQVAVVRELSANEKLTLFNIFQRALRVGRDHISSLVNTLVFAYVGATLPLIMLVSLMEIPWFVLISQEFIFIEIIRSLVGAIALVVAVPITTWLAVYVFFKGIREDSVSIESSCAGHHH